MSSAPIRVVQWTTGNVARQAVRAILERPELELVGVYAYSPDKVGKDAGELVGLDKSVGVTATDDVDAILALQPDCVLYMPLHPDVEELCTLLRAGSQCAEHGVVHHRAGVRRGGDRSSSKRPPRPVGQVFSAAASTRDGPITSPRSPPECAAR